MKLEIYMLFLKELNNISLSLPTCSAWLTIVGLEVLQKNTYENVWKHHKNHINQPGPQLKLISFPIALPKSIVHIYDMIMST